MNRGQTDQLLDGLARVEGAVHGLHPVPVPVLAPYRVPGRDYDELGLQIPRNPFRGKAGVLLLLQMGMARQFERVVPESHVLRPGAVPLARGVVGVACPCGVLALIEAGEVVECAGACDRWFLETETSVRVAKWPREADDDVVV